MSKKEVRKIKETLEWVGLVKEASNLGLSKEEVRKFLRAFGEVRNKSDHKS